MKHHKANLIMGVSVTFSHVPNANKTMYRNVLDFWELEFAVNDKYRQVE